MMQTPEDKKFTINSGRGDVEVTGLTGAIFIHTKHVRTGANQVVLLTSRDREVMREALDLADERQAQWRIRNPH